HLAVPAAPRSSSRWSRWSRWPGSWPCSLRDGSGLPEDTFGVLAVLDDELGEFVERHAAGLDAALDEHSLAEVRVRDDARHLAGDLPDDRLRRTGGREQPEPGGGIIVARA